MELCPVCRFRDPTCKIRLLRGQTFFSCKSCYEAEERKPAPRTPEPRGPWTDERPPFPELEEPPLPKWDEQALADRG
jgi:hypothetical protein